MKKHSKKIFAALALILALACALTACAPAAASSGKTESKASEVPASSKAEEKPVTVKYINRDAKPDSGDYDAAWKAINDLLLKNINCTIDVEFLGSGDKAQMALKYAGNEQFDFAFDAIWWGYAANAANNAYREYTMDEVKQYMPYMYEKMPAIGWKQSEINGKMYIIPNLKWEYNYSVVMYRGDLLEKYGMSDLKTLDDMEKYMENVVKNESGIEPFFNNDRVADIYLYNPNGWITSYSGFYYRAKETANPSVFYNVMTDEYMAYAKKMREFYEKGFWSPDAANDSSSPKTKFETGLQATYLTNAGSATNIATSLAESHPEYKIKFFNPSMGAPVVNTSFCSNGWSINRHAEHPTQAMQIINFFYSSEECQKLLCWGFEGVNYDMKDGKVITRKDVPADQVHNIGCNWNMSNTLIINAIDGTPKYEGYDEIAADYEKNTFQNPMQAFNFDRTAVETEVANVSAIETEYKSIVYGMNADVEATVSEYRQKLKDAGLDKVQAEYDRQIKEFMASYSK